jgi:hypothetical protein
MAMVLLNEMSGIVDTRGPVEQWKAGMTSTASGEFISFLLPDAQQDVSETVTENRCRRNGQHNNPRSLMSARVPPIRAIARMSNCL